MDNPRRNGRVKPNCNDCHTVLSDNGDCLICLAAKNAKAPSSATNLPDDGSDNVNEKQVYDYPYDETKTIGGVLGKPGSQGVRMVLRAIKEGWPIPEETRQRVMDQLAFVVADADVTTDRGFNQFILSTKSLLMADNANIKREALHLEERESELADATRIITSALRSKRGRKQLSNISDAKLTQDGDKPA
jgi:hypothetical protein